MLNNSGPLQHGLVDSDPSVHQRWPGLTMVSKSVPLNWWGWTRGWLDCEDTSWTTTLILHMNINWKKIYGKGGDLGSNPGPEHYHSSASPTRLFVFFVYIITNNEYKINQRVSGSLARDFERTNQNRPPSHLLHCLFFSWKYKTLATVFQVFP